MFDCFNQDCFQLLIFICLVHFILFYCLALFYHSLFDFSCLVSFPGWWPLASCSDSSFFFVSAFLLHNCFIAKVHFNFYLESISTFVLFDYYRSVPLLFSLIALINFCFSWSFYHIEHVFILSCLISILYNQCCMLVSSVLDDM